MYYVCDSGAVPDVLRHNRSISNDKRVVVGCMNPKAGCAGSILNLLQMPQFNHQVELTTGVLEEECSQMMKTFFKELREKRKKNKQ